MDIAESDLEEEMQFINQNIHCLLLGDTVQTFLKMNIQINPRTPTKEC